MIQGTISNYSRRMCQSLAYILTDSPNMHKLAKSLLVQIVPDVWSCTISWMQLEHKDVKGLGEHWWGPFLHSRTCQRFTAPPILALEVYHDMAVARLPCGHTNETLQNCYSLGWLLAWFVWVSRCRHHGWGFCKLYMDWHQGPPHCVVDCAHMCICYHVVGSCCWLTSSWDLNNDCVTSPSFAAPRWLNIHGYLLLYCCEVHVWVHSLEVFVMNNFGDGWMACGGDNPLHLPPHKVK